MASIEKLLDWVNTFNYPDCLIATDIDDFRNGKFTIFDLITITKETKTKQK